MICKHCHKAIKYGSATGWTHTDNKSVWCDNTSTKQAEPKR